MTHLPYVIEKSGSVERSYDIFSRLLKDRVIILTGEVCDELANSIIAQLLFLDAQGHDPIYLYINSPGGSITAGLAIYDTLRYISSPINTICVGMAASMGALLLLAGDKRYALEHSEIMIHQPLGGFRGQTSDVLLHAKWLESIRDKVNEIMAYHTKRTVEDIERDTDRDHFLTAKQALEYGIIDEILTSKKERI